MGNKYMKNCSASLITRKMQIKTRMTYHFTPDRMATIKMTRKDEHWQRRGEGNTSALLMGMQLSAASMENL